MILFFYPYNGGRRSFGVLRIGRRIGTIEPGVIGNGQQGSAVGPGAFDSHYSMEKIAFPFQRKGRCADGLADVLVVGSLHIVKKGAIAKGDPAAVGFNLFVGQIGRASCRERV